MKSGSMSLSFVLLLILGLMVAISFSLGCTEQESSTGPEESAGAEPVESVQDNAGQTEIGQDRIEKEGVEQEEAGIENSGINGMEDSELQETVTDEQEPDEVEEGEGLPGFEENQEEEFETSLAEEIVNIEWQWEEVQEPGLAGNMEIPNPEAYTIVFSRHGTYSIKADCNRGGGSYALEGNSLTLGAGPLTLAECGPNSLDDRYVELLSYVNSAEMQKDRLVLYFGEEDSMMTFSNGGVIEGI